MTMSSINHSSVDMWTTSAMVAFVTPGHDEGLCHEHRWAGDVPAERRAYPRVADPSMLRTPSSAIHDDIHYAG